MQAYKLSPLILCILLTLFSGNVMSEPSSLHTDANALAKLVASRKGNEGRVGVMHFRLQNSRLQTKQRKALMLHSDESELEKIAIFFTHPAMIEDTAFLTLNHETLQDENWLFLPATNRVRRLPSSDRGDYFLGTDLTFGDIQDNFKFSLEDWVFAIETPSSQDNLPILTGKAKSRHISEQIGYFSFRAKINLETAFPVWVEYTDIDGDELKRVDVLRTGVVGGVHTALHFVVNNHQTKHQTDVQFTNMRHIPDLDASIFTPESLEFGAPELNLSESDLHGANMQETTDLNASAVNANE